MFSTLARLGKIACLPNDIREQLNLRLHDGEQGPELLAWLNAQPEVRRSLRLDFEGKEITPQNLTNWRQGGYQDWVTQRQVNLLAFGMALETKEMRQEEDLHGQRLGERLVQWLLSRFLLAARELDQLEGEAKWKRMRELVTDLAELRRLEREARKDEEERKKARRDEREWQESLQWMLQSMKARKESQGTKTQSPEDAPAQASKPAEPAPPAVANPAQSRSFRTVTSQTAKEDASPNAAPPQPANPGESSPIKAASEPLSSTPTELPSSNPLVQMGVPEVSIPPQIQPNQGGSRVLPDSQSALGNEPGTGGSGQQYGGISPAPAP